MDGSQNISTSAASHWKILVVDEDRSAHINIKENTKDFIFEDKDILYYSAYNIQEAISILKSEEEMALVLIDVNIDRKDSGLKLVSHIRETLELIDIRIILMVTDEHLEFKENIVFKYDINGYSDKSEFFYRKINTVIVSSLRGYRDIKKIRNNKDTMKNVVSSITSLHKLRSLEDFLKDSICYLSRIINRCDLLDHSSGCNMNSFSAIREKGTERFLIVSGTGIYKDRLGQTIRDSVKLDNYIRLNELYLEGEHKLFHDIYIAKYKSVTGREAIILIQNRSKNVYVDEELLEVFYKSISANFDSLCLNLEIDDTQREILYTLGEVTEARSEETGYHIKRVSEYSTILAREYGLDENEIELIAKSSPIHDIGKVAIPDEILQKKGKLTPEEFNIIKTHTTIGYNLLKNSEGEVLKAAAIIANEHHERYDGKGYPRGLSGEDIHIYGRIVAVTDVFDALGSDRVYKKAWVMGDILNLFKDERGKHFDPKLVDILFENLDEFLAVKDRYEDGQLSSAQNCECWILNVESKSNEKKIKRLIFWKKYQSFFKIMLK